MKIHLRFDQYLELEKLGLGVFAPVRNFMVRKEFFSVVNKSKTPKGDLFPIPIFLDVNQRNKKKIKINKKIDLFFKNKKVGKIYPKSIFSCNKDNICLKIFGTKSSKHPGVKKFKESGNFFIGGRTQFLKRVKTDISRHEITPQQAKSIFKKNQYKSVVGFQTRNVPHRAHEYLQRIGLEKADCLFIQPLIGEKKVGDYTPEAIMRGYRALINKFYPKNRVVLGVLSTYMRYAGPKEALLHAIIRRNYGCTHFIVGRDHAGVGNFYKKYEAHNFLKKYEKNLGIKILYLKGPFYCKICETIVTENTCQHYTKNPNKIFEIHGKDIRRMLSGGKNPDNRIIRNYVLSSIKNCKNLFIK